MRDVTKSVLLAALLVGSVLATAAPVTAVTEDERKDDGNVVEQKVRGGPDKNHSVVIDRGEAVDVAEDQLSDGVDWSLSRLHLVRSAGFYDVRFTGDDGERAKVRVDGSSREVFFLKEKHPGDEADEDDDSDEVESADVSVTDYDVSDENVEVNESVQIDATVANDGGRAGTANVTLLVDDTAVHNHTVSVPADATNATSFEIIFHEAGSYAVAVEDLESTTITVTENESTADETGWIAGTVTDADTGDAVSNETVTLDDEHETVTDENGTYQFEGVTAGTHNVTVAATEYDNETEGVTVEGNEATTLDFALNSSVDPAPSASISFADQATAGSNVTVGSTTLENCGFVVVRNESGSVVGVSSHLANGTHENLSVSLDAPLQADQNLTAVAHRDTNGNGTFDYNGTNATLDGAYRHDGEPVNDTADVTVTDDDSATVTIEVLVDGATDVSVEDVVTLVSS